MNIHNIKHSFWRIGARVMVEPQRGSVMRAPAPRLVVERDEHGELFRLAFHPLRINAIEIADARPAQRRLLLRLHERGHSRLRHANRTRAFLCGRDGLGLFALDLPDWVPAHSVKAASEAMDALALEAPFEVKRRLARPARFHPELINLN